MSIITRSMLCLLCILFTACGSQVQTTSGKSYLKKYKNVPTVAIKNTDNINIEEKLREVANVEPTLTFPARIGLARIDNGRLSAIPSEEAEAWENVKKNLEKDFGEFVPVSPLVVELVTESISSGSRNKINDVMNKIRLGAARQHLDAVLIYEVYSKTDTKNNVLSVADLTIIGGFILPSQAAKAVGFSNAMLIDVIQGYPYGTATAVLNGEEEIYSTSWGSYNRKLELSNSVKTKVAIKLSKEAEKMFKQLHKELKQK